jgi:transcriptional regulator with XRE-family HTH domain
MESTIGKRIRELRDKKQLSVAEFAKAAGVKASAIYGLESDANKPSIETVGALRIAFPDLNTEWLQFGVGSMFKEDTELTPVSQLPPPVPSKMEPLQAPVGPGTMTPEELREQMRIVAESSELREVKSERDHLRTMNESLLAIIRNFSGGATDAPATAGGGKAEASSYAADLRETVDELVEEYPLDYRIVAVKRIGFSPSHLRIA